MVLKLRSKIYCSLVTSRWMPYLIGAVVVGWVSLGIWALIDGSTGRAIFWLVLAGVWGVAMTINLRKARANPRVAPPRWWPYFAGSVVVAFLALGLTGVAMLSHEKRLAPPDSWPRRWSSDSD